MKKIIFRTAIVLVSVFALILIVNASNKTAESKKSDTSLYKELSEAAAKSACCESVSIHPDCDPLACAKTDCNPANCTPTASEAETINTKANSHCSTPCGQTEGTASATGVTPPRSCAARYGH